MEAEVVDIDILRSRRAESRRAAAAAFGRLPCPCCDRLSEAVELIQGQARYACDGGGSHAQVGWSYDGAETISDHMGRRRRYFAY